MKVFRVDVVCPKCDQTVNVITGGSRRDLLALAESFPAGSEEADICKACEEVGEVPNAPYAVSVNTSRKPPMRSG